jgi:nucleotide-binding universal stress UspA family protein
MDAREATEEINGSSWIRQIVVAADGSPASSQGLKQVANLAPSTGAQVVIVFVRHVPPTASMAPNASPSLREALDEQEAVVRKDVARIMGDRGVAWNFIVREGSPGDEIVKVVEETGADLVVVGSNRHSSLHNLLLGSTAAHLTSHSPAPVLVMRAKAAATSTPVAAGATH